MKLIRNYLTSEEIGIVITAMLEAQTEYERQMLRYGIIAQMLVEGLIISEDTDNNDIYDQIVRENIDLDKEIRNIHIVDTIVSKELSVSKAIEKTLNDIVAQVDESMKAIDPKTLMVELDKLKDSEAFKMLANV